MDDMELQGKVRSIIWGATTDATTENIETSDGQEIYCHTFTPKASFSLPVELTVEGRELLEEFVNALPLAP